jgi:hypothetical protein
MAAASSTAYRFCADSLQFACVGEKDKEREREREKEREREREREGE